jgi:threonine dehydrogenase-like Zn-dependent dehydrogenase
VGLCGVIAAKYLGAERIILLGHHQSRLDLARQFGATEIVTDRGEAAKAKVKEMTNGGAPHVLECVGPQSAMDTAIAITRPGGTILQGRGCANGYVGVPHGSSEQFNLFGLFSNNITLKGGIAPVRSYIPQLLTATIAGKIDASLVLDLTVDLDGVPKGYAAMDSRSAMKVMVLP